MREICFGIEDCLFVNGMNKKKGFTLLELLIVIIIIGILATLAATNFGKAKEDVLDKEAISKLALLQSAQKDYYLDMNSYYSSSDISNINSNLKVSLPSGVNQSWNYTVYNTGCSQATRNGGDRRTWYFSIADNGSDITNCAADGKPNKDCYTCS